jgi:aminopeptidase N
MLVYLPLTAFMDKTQLHFLFGGSRNLSDFVDEVGSHEVSHQWWGHMVGWCSYHDQWLSEGFASFSAGLYLEFAKGKKRAAEYWTDQRAKIQQKNAFGHAPYQAGPLWLGLRLGIPEKLSGSGMLMYNKGAFVLHMLRMLMWDSKKGDQDFIAMLNDYTSRYALATASTEDFKAIAEKHMTADLDLQKNGRLDWFFSEWVYSTELPAYKFNSSIAEAGRGQYTISGELTQSKVSDGFAMLVPIYLEYDKDDFRSLGRLLAVGNKTTPFKVTVPSDRKPRRALINAREDVLCDMSSKQ